MWPRKNGRTLYVQIRKDNICVRDIETKIEHRAAANGSFTTKRLLIGEFTRAEVTFKGALEQFDVSWFSAAPIMVVHPMEMVDDGISGIERRVLQELAAAVGARRVVIHVGATLDDHGVLDLVKTNV